MHLELVYSVLNINRFLPLCPQVYHPPSQDSSYSDVRKYIESLPAISTPQIFGMNDNAEKAFLEDQSKELIDSIISIQPRLATSLIG